MALSWPSSSDTGLLLGRAFALKQKILHFLEAQHHNISPFPDNITRLEVVQDFVNILLAESRVLDNVAHKREKHGLTSLCSEFGWTEKQEVWEWYVVF
jgi:hypothetical protein